MLEQQLICNVLTDLRWKKVSFSKSLLHLRNNLFPVTTTENSSPFKTDQTRKTRGHEWTRAVSSVQCRKPLGIRSTNRTKASTWTLTDRRASHAANSPLRLTWHLCYNTQRGSRLLFGVKLQRHKKRQNKYRATRKVFLLFLACSIL